MSALNLIASVVLLCVSIKSAIEGDFALASVAGGSSSALAQLAALRDRERDREQRHV